MRQLRVHFTIGDQINWAVDEDLAIIKEALTGVVDKTDFLSADVVFAAWWAPLLDLDPMVLARKTVICSMHGDPARFLATPAHAKIFDVVNIWLARSRTAADRLNTLGFKAIYIPYGWNPKAFHLIDEETPALSAMRSRLGKIRGKYLVGSFMRDSEGGALNAPKLVKGPDMLLQVLLECHRRKLPVLPVLAGPRRHWLRQHLDNAGIHYVFLGEKLEQDDMSENMLDRHDLNLLYNIIDLSIVSSRSEGGPLAVCEATAAGCKMIATRVGMVPDIVSESAIFSTAQQAADLIADDIQNQSLDQTLILSRQRLAQEHSTDAIRSHLQRLLEMIGPIDTRPNRFLFRIGSIAKKIRTRLSATIEKSEDQRARKVHLFNGADRSWNLSRVHDHLFLRGVFVHSAAKDADILLVPVRSLPDFDLSEVRRNASIAILADSFPYPQDDADWQNELEEVYHFPGFVGTVFPSQAVLENWRQLRLPVSKPVLSYPPIVTYQPPTKPQKRHGSADTVFFVRSGGMPSEIEAAAAQLHGYTFCGLDDDPDTMARILTEQHGIFVEDETGSDALGRIRVARLAGIPVVFRQSVDSKSIVQFGGVGFHDLSEMPTALDLVASSYTCFVELGESDPEASIGLDDTLRQLVK